MELIDVTKENKNIVTMLKITNGVEDVKVFESGNTEFIISYRGKKKHLSIYNPYREVKKSEIENAARRLFRRNASTLKKVMGTNGIIHLHG